MTPTDRPLGDRRWASYDLPRSRVERLAAGRMVVSDWSFWETVIADRGIVIDRQRGRAHPSYPDMIYPCDYGHVPGTTSEDGHPVDAFVGSGDKRFVGLIALRHQPSGIRDPKLLVGLGRDEAEALLVFLDKGKPGPDLRLVRRN